MKKYILDQSHILGDELPLVSQDGILDITPEQILQSRECTLRNRNITKHLIKWTGYPGHDATWEWEDSLIQTYPNFVSR